MVFSKAYQSIWHTKDAFTFRIIVKFLWRLTLKSVRSHHFCKIQIQQMLLIDITRLFFSNRRIVILVFTLVRVLSGTAIFNELM